MTHARVFGDRSYRWHKGPFARKSDAERAAKSARQDGYLARITKRQAGEAKEYHVWIAER